MHDHRSINERLADMRDDPALELTVDGSAVGGLLAAVFGRDVTAETERCAHCGTLSVIATMRVYSRGPGAVVRCPACTEVVLRIVETPTGLRIDVSGATHLRG
jgi:phage FluMu protein Com